MWWKLKRLYQLEDTTNETGSIDKVMIIDIDTQLSRRRREIHVHFKWVSSPSQQIHKSMCNWHFQFGKNSIFPSLLCFLFSPHHFRFNNLCLYSTSMGIFLRFGIDEGNTLQNFYKTIHWRHLPPKVSAGPFCGHFIWNLLPHPFVLF